MNKSAQAIKYFACDFFAAMLAWILFFFYRKVYIEHEHEWYQHLFVNKRFYIGSILIPVCWVVVYYMQGTYNDPYRRSRLNEFIQTFYTALLGVLILFFALLLDDNIQSSYKNYYKLFGVLFSLQFMLTAIPRFIISSTTNHKIQKRKIGFNTLIIGSNENAWNIFNEIQNLKSFYRICAYRRT